MTIRETLHHLARLAKEYFWDSKHRYRAILLLTGIVLGIICSIALAVIFAWYINIFFTALSAMNIPLFITSLEIILSTLIGSAVIKYCSTQLSGLLAASWREFLTQRLLNQFSNDTQFLALNRNNSNIENIEVTPVDSIRDFVELTLSLGTDLLEKTMTLPIYIRILWVLGGALSFIFLGASITIPGYLVFAAIIFTIIASVASHYIGHALNNWLNQNINSEANMRKEIAFINDNAENIALTNTINLHQQSLVRETQAIKNSSSHIAKIRAGIQAFNDFCQPIAFLFPYVVAAPLYFAKKITEGALFSIGYAFGQVYYSLSWFIDSYEYLSQYTVSLNRIIELEKAMENQEQNTQANEQIMIQQNSLNALHMENLTIAKNPANTAHILRNLNLTLDPQRHTFIRGDSGVGKSTLFKVIAGTWQYGHGNIFFPPNYKPCFLPQAPVIPANYTLKELLNYTDAQETHTQEEYEQVLRQTRMAEFIKDLDNTQCDWVRTLSGGQKQTIAFARILLKKEKPTMIFLDESTSAMDTERQTLMYQLIHDLKNTKMVTISHNPSVIQFHDDIVDLSVDQERTASSSIISRVP